LIADDAASLHMQSTAYSRYIRSAFLRTAHMCRVGHNHIYIYIYIYICVFIYSVCALILAGKPSNIRCMYTALANLLMCAVLVGDLRHHGMLYWLPLPWACLGSTWIWFLAWTCPQFRKWSDWWLTAPQAD
jgi:hypothetical protein